MGRRDSACAESFNPHSSFRPSATPHVPLRRMRGKGFNPHSSFRPSATNNLAEAIARRLMFQSSLELSPECNTGKDGSQGRQRTVSILTRAFARVQPAIKPRLRPLRFQSSLELSPECNRGRPRLSRGPAGFNPHSSFRPSATPGDGSGLPHRSRFNPHSSFRPSATASF